MTCLDVLRMPAYHPHTGDRSAGARPGKALLTALVLAGVALAASACSRLPGLPGRGDRQTAGMVEDRVWIDTGEDAPRGTLRAFLSNGTLIMTSCTETYRLAAWRWVEGSTLVWDEDGEYIRAEVGLVGRDELALVMDLGGETVTRRYKLARAPVVCRDLR